MTRAPPPRREWSWGALLGAGRRPGRQRPARPGADGGARCRPWVNASRATSSRAAPSRSGSWPAASTAPPRRVARRRCRLVGDTGRDRLGHLAAVHGGADHPQDHDAQCTTELGADLGDRRGGPGPLRRGGSHGEVGDQGVHRRQRHEKFADPATSSGSPLLVLLGSWVSSPKPTAARARPAAITTAGGARRTSSGVAIDPRMNPAEEGNNHSPASRASDPAPAAGTRR
jgi:hypothetical protein